MLVGHYGVALGLKRMDPRMSLGTLFIGTQLVDILWALFVLLGWERAQIDPGHTAVSPFQFLSYPLSHSLLAGVAWAAVAAAVYASWPTKDTSHRRRGALVLGLAVLSHWFLDVVVHLPDLPLAGDDSARFGFGLWDSIPATFAVEFGLLAVGLWLYAAAKTKRHPLHRGRLILLVALLIAVSVASIVAPPPDSMTQVAFGALILYAGFAGLAFWVDHDPPTVAAESGGRKRKGKSKHR